MLFKCFFHDFGKNKKEQNDVYKYRNMTKNSFIGMFDGSYQNERVFSEKTLGIYKKVR